MFYLVLTGKRREYYKKKVQNEMLRQKTNLGIMGIKN